MKNLIDFMVDAGQNPELGKECIDKVHEGSHTALSSWLNDKGYIVSEYECKKLIDSKDHVKALSGIGYY